MNTKIPNFLLLEISKRHSYVDKFPTEIKSFMIDYANYYNWGLHQNLNKIIRVMRMGVTTLPICAYEWLFQHCIF